MLRSRDCFLLAQSYVISLDYSGPMALVCDDTKVHLSLQVVWDPAENSSVLVGSTLNRTVLVANTEELHGFLIELEDSVATKVWNMLLQQLIAPNYYLVKLRL